MIRSFIIVFLVIVAVLAQSCSGKQRENFSSNVDSTGKTATTPLKSGGLEGTYSTTEDGKLMEFTLMTEGKGFENYQGTEKRPFKWLERDGKVFFTYEGEKQELELPLDPANGEIHYGSLVYKKH